MKSAYEAEGEASLAGEPPQVRAWHDAVVVAVRRNHGIELDRVGPTDGKSSWSGGPAFLDAARADLHGADADSLRLYVPAAGKLFALTLEDGKPAWEVDLPARADWSVRAGPNAVVVYPNLTLTEEPFEITWKRVCASFARSPLPWRLPGLTATLYDSWTDRTVPVLLFHPETGKLLKKLSLPARGSYVSACFDGELAVVATGDRVVWLR